MVFTQFDDFANISVELFVIVQARRSKNDHFFSIINCEKRNINFSLKINQVNLSVSASSTCGYHILYVFLCFC